MAALCPPGSAWPEVVLSGVATAGAGTVGGGLGGGWYLAHLDHVAREGPFRWHLGCQDPLGQQRLWCRWGLRLQPTQPSEALVDMGLGPEPMHLEGVHARRLRPGTRVARRGVDGRSSGPRPSWPEDATGCGGSGPGPQQACWGLRNMGRCWPHSPPIPQSPEGSSLSPLIHLP